MLEESQYRAADLILMAQQHHPEALCWRIFFFLVSLCVHTCVHIYMCKCMCACGGQRASSGVALQALCSLGFEAYSLTGLALTSRLDWLARESHRPSCLCLSRAGITRASDLLKMWVLGIRLRFLCVYSTRFTN